MLSGAGLIGVYRNGGTSANQQDKGAQLKSLRLQKKLFKHNGCISVLMTSLYLLSSNNAEWTRTSDLVNFTTEQVAADTGFRAPYTISSNGRMGSVTPQDRDMGSSGPGFVNMYLL